MAPIGWHIVLRYEQDRVVARTIAERRTVAASILRPGGEANLLAFGVADTHIHIEAACDRRAAGRLAWRTELAIQAAIRPGVPFDRPRFRPVGDQGHLRNTFFYCLRQDRHHGAGSDPFLEGTNLPDLLGLRHTGSRCGSNVRRWLPRITRSDLLALLGDPDLEAVAPDQIVHLAEAGAAAGCLVDIRGRRSTVLAARRAAVEVARGYCGVRKTAELLGVSPRTVERCRAEAPDPELVAAIRRQLALRGQATHESVGRASGPEASVSRCGT